MFIQTCVALTTLSSSVSSVDYSRFLVNVLRRIHTGYVDKTLIQTWQPRGYKSRGQSYSLQWKSRFYTLFPSPKGQNENSMTKKSLSAIDEISSRILRFLIFFLWKKIPYHYLHLMKLQHCQDQSLSHHCTLPDRNTEWSTRRLSRI
jgi:hypothetical protein